MKHAFWAASAAALLLFGTAPTAAAETQAERDKRRAAYFEGFVCHINYQGHSVKMKYLPGGAGDVFYQTGATTFTWRVEKDQFCTKWLRGEERCSTLPNRNIGDERDKFLAALRTNCL